MINFIDNLTNNATKVFEKISDNFYWYSYVIGLIAIFIFDTTAITDDFVIFFILSFIIAPIIGFLVLFALILLNGAIGIINDVFKRIDFHFSS